MVRRRAETQDECPGRRGVSGLANASKQSEASGKTVSGRSVPGDHEFGGATEVDVGKVAQVLVLDQS